MFTRKVLVLCLLTALVIVVAVVSMGIGRFAVPPNEAARIIIANVLQFLHVDGIVPLTRTWSVEEATVVMSVRLPRVLLALIIGGGLAVAGASLQALFHNPLVSPDVIGVSSGSAFGGVAAIAAGAGILGILGGSFATGLCAVGLVLLFGRVRSGSPILMIVLGGIVTASFFSALVSLVTYLADPYTTLPSITFWLMGSLASASYEKVLVSGIPVVLGLTIVLTLRWRLNILALGDEDAISLGLHPKRLRLALIATVALMTASTVAVAGIIGWVGLVIPHFIRLFVGGDYRQVIPGAFIMGGGFLVLIDTLSRSLSAGEIPLGVTTALIGAPFFAYLLICNRNKELHNA